MTATPGQRIACHIHSGTTVLLPHHNGEAGQHERFIARSEPYEDNGEWWVDVAESRTNTETFPIALATATLPI